MEPGAGAVQVDRSWSWDEDDSRPASPPGAPAARPEQPAWKLKYARPRTVDASAAALRPFITGHIEPGARVITDAWQGYHGPDASATSTNGEASAPRSSSAGEDLGELLPAVHRVASLAKRWLPGTGQTRHSWSP
jgi:hypothetical protein